MTGALDRNRANEMLSRYGIDALVLAEPEAFRYATGAIVGPSGLLRRAGSQFAIVPRDPALPIAAVVPDFDANRIKAISPDIEIRTHPSWIETVRLPGDTADMAMEARIEAALAMMGRDPDFHRPGTFDPKLGFQRLKGLLADLGLARSALGLDLDFIPANDLQLVRSFLADNSILDGSPALDRLRAIKSEGEIAWLRSGLEFSEIGLGRIVSEGRVGHSQYDLIDLFNDGVAAAAKEVGLRTSTLYNLSLGVRPKPMNAPAAAGDPLKVDVAVVVEGYASDMCRNFVFGTPTADQRRLHEIAERAFEAGLAELRPGRTLGDVHSAATAALAAEGLPSFRRGHFGHGIGQSIFSEQWPFICHGSDVVIEPNMVLAYEIPLYVEGVGPFNLEDQFLITASGPETMNRMPRRLVSIDG